MLTTIGIGDLIHQYAILFSFVFFWLFCNLGGLLNFRAPAYIFWYFPLFSYLAWVYGIFLALLNGVSSEAYIRNFAALWFYLFFYIIYYESIVFEKIFDLLKKLSLLYSFVALFFLVQNLFIGQFTSVDESGTVAFRLYYSVGLLVLFVPIVFILFGYFGIQRKSIFKGDSFWGHGVFVDFISLIYFSSLIFASGSKGFYLAFVVVLLVIVVNSFVRFLLAVRINKFIIFASVVWILIFICYNELLLSIIDVIFSMEFDEAHPRVLQGIALIEDFKFFGSGIGASISSGYTRDDLGYGFELSFHNVIHKLGFVSIFIFLMIFYPFLASLRNILITKNELRKSALSFSLMLYIFPAYGNPFLISPITVLFNVIALYILIPNSPRKS